MQHELLSTFNPCVWAIQITVWDGSGTQIPESALNITWSDGNPSGLTRYVNRDHTENYCVSISSIVSGEPGGQSCCEMEECILVTALNKCKIKNIREVIVNEINRTADEGMQFVELLVIGDAECQDSFDLRGFIVDDNNGYLIPGNDFLTLSNISGIGINPGYLMFANHTNWEKVPNGSLILIHSGRISGDAILPPDDPHDTNQDRVYVLAAENNELLWAKNGTWNEAEQLYSYEGYLIPPSWELIKPSPNADGMQVRYPDGFFSHGISIGETPFSAENDFFLWLTDQSPVNYNLSFTSTNYLDKNHFTWNSDPSGIQSPGLPNSIENAAFIDSLRNCRGLRSALPGPNFKIAKEQENKVRAYPNPFTDEIMLSFETVEGGEVKIEIYSPAGSMFYREAWQGDIGKNSHLLKTAGILPPGVHLLKFTFPTNETETLRIVRIR